MHPVITAKATNERNGIVTKPNNSTYLVVQETPKVHGATLLGRMPRCNKY